MDSIVLTLDKSAAKSGGDKYEVTGFTVPGSSRPRFLYVPQRISRQEGSIAPRKGGASGPIMKLQGKVSSTASLNSIGFKLTSKAKSSGDDRYSPLEAEQWTGDIYLPKIYRGYGDTVYLSITPQPAPTTI
jgi:hypothetical protein